MTIPSAPIKLNQLTLPGRSFLPTDVAAIQPSGSSCLPVTSLMIGLPTVSTFLLNSGCHCGSFLVSGRIASVARHQTIMTTIITVVAHMIFLAFELEEGMPRTLD